MITLDELVAADWPRRVRVNDRLGTVLDYWDGSGMGLCLADPIYVRVLYDDGQQCQTRRMTIA